MPETTALAARMGPSGAGCALSVEGAWRQARFEKGLGLGSPGTQIVQIPAQISKVVPAGAKIAVIIDKVALCLSWAE
jgi:hypothetical protein